MTGVSSRGQRGAILIALVACLVGIDAWAARWSEGRQVRDPHYGEVLYEFFQQNYFAALTSLMVSEHFERVTRHRYDAELLRGGMLLSYGLHLEAEKIFRELTEQVAEPVIRDRAWFFLAKVLYQRGHHESALNALGRIGGALPVDLEAERYVLEANALMTQARYAEAVAVLRRVPRQSDWALFGRYNLGVALVRAGESQQGIELLNEVGRERATTEELKALRDKSNVALGYAALQESQNKAATDYLERVRLEGLQSNKALLGMGWARSLQKDYERALIAWLELRGRSLQDTAVLESLLAIPYALGKVGAYKQSLQEYEHAIVLYDQELSRLDESIGAIRAGRLTDALLRINPGEDMGWFWQLRELPETPESRYLFTLLASHAFHEALKNFRDVQFLRGELARWAENMAVFDDMLATRRRAHGERLPRVLNEARARSPVQFQQERDRWAAELQRVETEFDVAALADPKRQDLLERLARVERGLGSLSGEEAIIAKEKYRRLRGVLYWDLTVDFKPRLWEAQRSLQELDAEVANYQERRSALEQAQRELPAKFDAFQQRIDESRARIRELQSKLAAASDEQHRYLSDLAVAELGLLQERIGTYLTQARFAVAQIYDQAAVGEEARP